MDISHLLNLTATITRVADTGAVDDYGDPTDETTTTTAKCWVDRPGWARDANERIGVENWQVELVDLFFPPGTALAGNDRVTVSGVTYELAGPPLDRIDPRTSQPVYVTATARRAT